MLPILSDCSVSMVAILRKLTRVDSLGGLSFVTCVYANLLELVDLHFKCNIDIQRFDRFVFLNLFFY